MKRNCTLFALFCCLALTFTTVEAKPLMTPSACEQTELPWSTVTAILQQVEDQVEFTFDELVNMYGIGRVTIEVVSEGYLVRTFDDDGILDSILISNL